MGMSMTNEEGFPQILEGKSRWDKGSHCHMNKSKEAFRKDEDPPVCAVPAALG